MTPAEMLILSDSQLAELAADNRRLRLENSKMEDELLVCKSLLCDVLPALIKIQAVANEVMQND